MIKLIYTCLILLTSIISPQTLVVSKDAINSVKFFAEATLSDFEGSTNAIEGSIQWDSVYTKNSSINLKVYLDSLDTGIGLRNSHMRNNYLETDKYPTADFNGTIINSNNISNSEAEVVVKGFLTIHGVKKELKIKGKIYNYGRLYKIDTMFDINLSDYKIDQPKFLFNKVDNKIILKLDVYFSKIN